MNDKKKVRPIVAVITTQVYDTEQRRYLSGIISEAQAFGYDTVIISNIYNSSEKHLLYILQMIFMILLCLRILMRLF